MKFKFTALVLGLLLAAIWGGTALAEEQSKIVGVVQKVKGEARVSRAGQGMAADPGLKLQQGDTLITGKASSMGVLFRDDSRLSLGSDSELIIDEFVFVPTEDKLGMVSRMVKGTAAFLTGRIAQKPRKR